MRPTVPHVPEEPRARTGGANLKVEISADAVTAGTIQQPRHDDGRHVFSRHRVYSLAYKLISDCTGSQRTCADHESDGRYCTIERNRITPVFIGTCKNGHSLRHRLIRPRSLPISTCALSAVLPALWIEPGHSSSSDDCAVILRKAVFLRSSVLLAISAELNDQQISGIRVLHFSNPYRAPDAAGMSRLGCRQLRVPATKANSADFPAKISPSQ
jgi:hypothetical protein